MFRVVFCCFLLFTSFSKAEDYFLHASFDVTRELFKDLNSEFTKEYTYKIKIRQSHGGSGKQASSIIHGMPADIVSLALPFHMDMLAKEGFVSENWRDLFPNNSSPMSTSIVFLVRKGNPKNILDWDDLVRSDIDITTANPKTSGGALWSYISAWIYANKKYKNHEEATFFMKKLYKNAPVLDSSARGAALSFIKRNMGDVLITWESEALSMVSKADKYEIIYPSVAVKIDIPVAVIIKSKKNLQEIANNYLNFLFSSNAQDIIKKHYYRTYKDQVRNLIDANEYINWNNFKKVHFADNGIFEQIYK